MTLQKVAELAGVSTSTVSRVVNNHPSVAPETSRLVRQAMDEASFQPSLRRRRRNGSSGDTEVAINIGLLFTGSGMSNATPGTERLIRGISSAATAHGVNLSIRFVKARGGDPKPADFAGLHGILLQGGMPDDRLRKVLESMPTVWLMANQGRPEWGDQVLPDSAAIGQLAADYLLDRGHQYMVACSLDWNSWAMEIRAHSFARAAQDRGAQATLLLPTNGQPALSLSEAADTMAQRIAALEPRPTGLFIAEDRQVSALFDALARLGITHKPQGDIEAISCNKELVYLLSMATPPATIDICFETIGRRGLELLLARVQQRNNEDRLRVLVEPTLVKNIHAQSGPDHKSFNADHDSLHFPSN